MKENHLSFKRGTLWKLIQERSARAKKLGVLQAIQTTSEFVQQNSLQFLVRIVSNLEEKDRGNKEKDQKACTDTGTFNPFLPYNEELCVSDISQTHVCLLNKFHVIDNHILLVTRVFEDQESLLTADDFKAMWSCMAEFEGLAFYNSGQVAGASQQHKHLQIVPLPLASEGPKVPIESALIPNNYQKGVGKNSTLPFVHAISPVNPHWLDATQQGAEENLQGYYFMLKAVGLLKDKAEKPLGAYNLLITREWMFLVPRSKECFGSISINALGFAGALLVKNPEAMQKVKQMGPLRILQKVAVSR